MFQEERVLTKSKISSSTLVSVFLMIIGRFCLTYVRAGYQRPTGLVEDRTMFLKVTEGDSVFDATAPEGLQISKDEPLLWWMNRYDEYHGITMPTPMKTKVEWTRNLLKVQNLSIRCHRTLRVPDTGNASHLPPVCLQRINVNWEANRLPGHGHFPILSRVSAWVEGPRGYAEAGRLHHGKNSRQMCAHKLTASCIAHVPERGALDFI
jgi:hypothetical protein